MRASWRSSRACARTLALALSACGPATGPGGESDIEPSASDGGASVSGGASATEASSTEATTDATTDEVDPCAGGPNADNGCTCSVTEQTCPAGEKCVQTGWGTSVDVFCVELPEEPVNDGEPCRVDELGVDDCAAHSSCWVYPDGADVGECVPNCGAEFTCPEGRRCVHLLGQCLAYCDPLEASACPGSERCVEVTGTGLFLCVDATGDVPPGEACTLSSDCHVGGACKSVGVGAVCAEGVDRCCVPLCDLEDPVACQELPTTTCDAWPIPGGLPEPLAHVGVCREP